MAAIAVCVSRRLLSSSKCRFRDGQETFLKLYRSRAWERMADEKAFLARVAWRIAVSQLRKAPTNPLGAETASTAESPEHAAIVSDWSTTVCRLIDALPEELRQPLALSSIEVELARNRQSDGDSRRPSARDGHARGIFSSRN
jgi:hypothetical protein